MRPDVQAPVPLLPSREVADLLRIAHKPVREYIHQGHIRAIDNKSDGKQPTQAVSVQVLKGNRLPPTSYHSQVLQNRAVRFDLAFKAFFHLYITRQQHSNPAVRSRQHWGKAAGLIRSPYHLHHKRDPEPCWEVIKESGEGPSREVGQMPLFRIVVQRTGLEQVL